MGAFLKLIFWLWVGCIVVVLVFQVLSAVFEFLGKLLEPSPVVVESPKNPKVTFAPQHNRTGLTLDDVKPATSLPISSGNSHVFSPLELLIEHVDSNSPRSRLEFKIRGGENDSGTGSTTYFIMPHVKIGTQVFRLGDSTSVREVPAAFHKSYVLRIPKPKNGRWVLIAAPLVEEVLPPRGGLLNYQFVCEVYRTGLPSPIGAKSPVGDFVEKAECAVQLNLPGPGYIDEIEWLNVRQAVVRLMCGLVRACVVNVDDKRAALYAWMQAARPVARHAHRRSEAKTQLLKTHADFDQQSIIDLGVFCEVRDSKDTEMMESLARLVLEVASKEPGGSAPRRAFSSMRDLFNVYLDGKHITTVWPEPPLQLVAVPRAVEAKTPFALKLVPFMELDAVKGIEVFVKGKSANGDVGARTLNFWAWDHTDDNPLLVGCSDIDFLHERAMHQRSWSAGQYDPDSWQSAGFVSFNEFLPPHGGQRSLVFAGRLTEFSTQNTVKSDVTVRSDPALVKIASRGYHTIRDARFQLRRQALVLAFGLALISGKGPTFMQDKTLKFFADSLCRDLADRDYADSRREFFRNLLESSTVSDFDHLRRLLNNFASKAPDDLKSQLYATFVKVMASRKVRSKESRELLLVSKQLLGLKSQAT